MRIGFFRSQKLFYRGGYRMSEKDNRCMVCGKKLEKGKICECCRESFMLCDIEDYIERKAGGKFCCQSGQTLSNKPALW